MRTVQALTTCIAAGLIAVNLSGCNPATTTQGAEDLSGRTIKVVTTIAQITDVVRLVGGDRVEVTGLMGAGTDPHLYQASEGDVRRLSQADIIFYNGGDLGHL